ncbi:MULTISPECIES: hypothetical protein [Virgibacillus]|uniref:hypothetical protein n=1 Tax=Virgibacillus TaxID=84406 RepID=UPI0009544012|nr:MULTISPECIES: hypothetical protein [Virgibacillus]MBS7430328.1 hypothetical protein [Virgibacillus sp. 19R1-5]MBU8567401.1 hypothetical protein [Virgibacillus pantothenticus]MBU8598982.1 hypothetical protein [Virgibacillus pantothenticus]MBU8633752.1 hypothetical protein [Virgibacillus pantothenticus]MBU8641270.1 hypothetical protein [Virgibacillus pantothenticus]
MYRIVAIGHNRVRAIIAVNEQEMIFETYTEAEKYLLEAKKANVIPDNYKLTIEKQ